MTPRSSRSERGVAMVEMAMILPLFLLLIFGIFEAGWAFAQLNDVHHGVREGARLAAVNYDPDDDPSTNDVLSTMCDRMGLASSSGPIIVTLAASDTNGDLIVGRGDTATSSVSVDYKSLTGFLDSIFGSTTLSSEVDFRLEQPLELTSAAWMTANTPCP
jgi:Flp pilus assembly protein TadG